MLTCPEANNSEIEARNTRISIRAEEQKQEAFEYGTITANETLENKVTGLEQGI